MANNFDAMRMAVQAVFPTNDVLMDDKDEPSIMVYIPAFRLCDVLSTSDTSVHPAFRMNGKEIAGFYMGKYQTKHYNGRAYSLPAQDPAFEKSSKWRNIPEWSEAVGAACAENGIPFADNTEICQTYADLWQPDGIHVRPEFYPYWAANLILAGLDSPAEAEDATNETENDPA